VLFAQRNPPKENWHSAEDPVPSQFLHFGGPVASLAFDGTSVRPEKRVGPSRSVVRFNLLGR